MAGRRATGRQRATVGPGTGDAATLADPESAARAVCLRLLTIRPRSRAELATVLARTEVPTEVAERVLDRLGEVGLVDDPAYAELVVRSGRQRRSLGRNGLSAELRRRGVDDDTASAAIAAIGPGDEEDTARRLVERRLRAMPGLDDAARIRRLEGLLARRGYPEELARRVVRDVLREHGVAAELPDPEHMT